MSSIPRATLYIRNGVTAGVCDPRHAQRLVSAGIDTEARHARYVLRDHTLSDDRTYVAITGDNGVKAIAEVRAEHSGKGHTLVAVHVVPQ